MHNAQRLPVGASALDSMVAGQSAESILHLYRNILKAAKYFPSKKRDRIITGIKEEFHGNKALSDPEKIKQCLAVARRGLSDLQSYLPSNSASGEAINITLKGATE